MIPICPYFRVVQPGRLKPLLAARSGHWNNVLFSDMEMINVPSFLRRLCEERGGRGAGGAGGARGLVWWQPQPAGQLSLQKATH